MITDAQRSKIASDLKSLFKISNDSDYEIAIDGSVAVFGDCIKNSNVSGVEMLPITFSAVDGEFNVSGMGLTSLRGCPRTVETVFSANDNPGLVNLDGAPDTVGECVELHGCGLESLEGIPRNAIEYVVSSNNLKSLAGIHSDKKSISIDAQGNQLESLIGCPPNVVTLDITDQTPGISSLQGIPRSIKHIGIDESAPVLLLLTTSIPSFVPDNGKTYLKMVGKKADLQKTVMSMLQQYHGAGHDGVVPLAARLMKANLRNYVRL